jgi:hypothetical protein
MDAAFARGCAVETDPERVAAMMLGLGDSRVLVIGGDDKGLVVEAETKLDVDAVRCPGCHASVVLDGTEELEQERPPSFGRATVVIWRLRRFRCENASCPVEIFVEDVPPLRPA